MSTMNISMKSANESTTFFNAEEFFRTTTFEAKMEALRSLSGEESAAVAADWGKEDGAHPGFALAVINRRASEHLNVYHITEEQLASATRSLIMQPDKPRTDPSSRSPEAQLGPYRRWKLVVTTALTLLDEAGVSAISQRLDPQVNPA